MYDQRFVAAGAVAILVTLVAIFSLRPFARRIGLVDKPNERKRHRGRVPLIGGLCFFLGTLAGLAYFEYLDRFVVCLIAMGALIFLTGLVDDMGELSVRSRLLIQVGTAALMIALTGVYIDSGGHLFGDGEFRLYAALGVPLTIVAVVGLINAFNMLDGIDGLAGGLAVTSIVAALAFAGGGASLQGVMLLLQILAATLVAYLCVNMGWPDGRKIFMGDAGSTLLGFVLAWSLIHLSQGEVALLAPVDVLWCIALPIMDTLGVMWRRMRRGRSPFTPDRQHLHHLLIDAGCPSRLTLLLMIALGAGLAGFGYALRDLPETVSLVAFGSVLVAYILWLPLAIRRVRAVAGVPDRIPELPNDFAVVRDRSLRLASRGGTARPGGESAVAGAPALAPGALVKALCVLDASTDSLKVGPVVQQLMRDGRFDVKVCMIALPDQQSGRILKLFDIHPDHILDVKAPTRDLDDISSAPLRSMKRILRENRPDVVLVHGETLASLAGTLAAYFHKIPVACVKTSSTTAGNPAAEAPDEAVRKITGSLASLHIAATEVAGRELIAAGIPQDRVTVANHAAAEVAHAIRRSPTRSPADSTDGQEAEPPQDLAKRFPFLSSSRQLLLVSNPECDEDLIHVGSEMWKLASIRPNLDIVYPLPLHMRQRLLEHGGGESRQDIPANLNLVEPLDATAFQYLLNAAYLVLARSATVQREAALLNKPVLMMRSARDSSATAHPDSASPVVIDPQKIAECVLALLSDPRAYEAMRFASGSCGTGGIGLCIVEALAGLPRRVAKAAA